MVLGLKAKLAKLETSSSGADQIKIKLEEKIQELTNDLDSKQKVINEKQKLLDQKQGEVTALKQQLDDLQNKVRNISPYQSGNMRGRYMLQWVKLHYLSIGWEFIKF